MFGLPSGFKLLLIAAVIAAVWYFFKRHQLARRGGGAARQAPAQDAKPIEDMTQCRACGTYFPADSRCSCGRS